MCAPGFYAKKGSKKPCQKCAEGRTTARNEPGILVTDCIVAAGYGVVDSASNSTNPFNPDTTAMTADEKAALSVLECPVGFYGAGGAMDSKCIPCGTGATTKVPGAYLPTHYDGE